jgi:hypothetical protein
MCTEDGAPAFSLVLHTWGQELQRHIHVHAVMACGVLDKAVQWAMPVHKSDIHSSTLALTPVLRGKFMAALNAAHKNGQIARDPQAAHSDWCHRQKQL